MLGAIKKLEYPGGSVTLEVEKLEAKVEKAGTRLEEATTPQLLLAESTQVKLADPQLAVFFLFFLLSPTLLLGISFPLFFL